VVQIVALACALADAAEDRVTTVRLGDVVDELLNQHRLADTGTSEESDLSSSCVRGKQVDDLSRFSSAEAREGWKKGDLDAGLKDFSGGGLVNELRSLGVDAGDEVRRHTKQEGKGKRLHLLGVDGPALVDGFADHVYDPAEALWPDRNHNRSTGVHNAHATDETLSSV
jgi:hypothetical protein